MFKEHLAGSWKLSDGFSPRRHYGHHRGSRSTWMMCNHYRHASIFLFIIFAPVLLRWMQGRTMILSLSKQQQQDTMLLLADPKFERLDKKESSSSSRFAYVFLLGGLDPDQLASFRGYLYNIAVATYTLRTTGSVADILLLIQPSQPNQKLPQSWHQLLETELGIQVQYLHDDADDESSSTTNKNSKQSFFSIMMQKFKVLRLIQYDRILFLDGDIVPFCNLDYLFQASMDGIIQPQFVITGTDAPAAGNFFLLEPAKGDYERLWSQLVQPALAGGHWDKCKGWGHRIDSSDPWYRLGFGASKYTRKIGWGEYGTHWNFHGGPADQGLLYHWVKYVKRNVTIAVGSQRVETWKDASSGNNNADSSQPVLVSKRRHHPLHALSCRKRILPRDYSFLSKEGTTAPYSDYEHNKKIWERQKLPNDIANRFLATSPAQFWFHTLRLLQRQYPHFLNIDWEHWLEHIGNKERPYGKAPDLKDFEGAGAKH